MQGLGPGLVSVPENPSLFPLLLHTVPCSSTASCPGATGGSLLWSLEPVLPSSSFLLVPAGLFLPLSLWWLPGSTVPTLGPAMSCCGAVGAGMGQSQHRPVLRQQSRCTRTHGRLHLLYTSKIGTLINTFYRLLLNVATPKFCPNERTNTKYTVCIERIHPAVYIQNHSCEYRNNNHHQNRGFMLFCCSQNMLN